MLYLIILTEEINVSINCTFINFKGYYMRQLSLVGVVIKCDDFLIIKLLSAFKVMQYSKILNHKNVSKGTTVYTNQYTMYLVEYDIHNSLQS